PATALGAGRAAVRLRLVARGDAPILARIAGEPVGDLVVGEEDRLRALLGQPRGFLWRRERRLDDATLGVVDGRRGRCRDCRRSDRRGRDQRGRRGEKTPQRLLRNDDNLLPRKLSGVTRTTAIACETIFPRPASTNAVSSARFAP